MRNQAAFKLVIITCILFVFVTSGDLLKAQCGGFAFHASEFTPSGIWKGSTSKEPAYPNDYAKTINCDAPWRVDSLDSVIPIYFQVEGTDVDALNELHCLAVYDVSNGSEPPDPVEDFWGNYEYTPDSDQQIFKEDCGGCELATSQEGMFWRTVTTFKNDGAYKGIQPDGTVLTARNLGYTEADMGHVITLTIRIIYEESLNWTDIHDQDIKIYIGKAPLPRQENWYLGDPHTHTWSTYYSIEIGASGLAMFQSQVSCGLQWEQITDHAYNMTDGKWDSMAQDVVLGNNIPEFVALHGLECDDGYGLGDAHHFLGFNLPDWIETYNSNPPVNDSLAVIQNWNGFSYGAHTTTDGWLWSDDEVRSALAFPCFRGLQDYNERRAYTSDDILHPWGSSPSSGSWDVTHTNWDNDLNAGISRWDKMMSEFINSDHYDIFFMGGSDAHGSMNYHIEWNYSEKEILYGASSNALGKIRNAVYIPETFDQNSLKAALHQGRLIVTDGPFIALGISFDGTAEQYSDCDLLIGDTGDVNYSTSDATLFLTWTSSEDWGEIKKILVYTGDETTENSPETAWTITPENGMNGSINLPLNSILKSAYLDEDPNPDFYIRATACTYDPETGVSEPGDCSVPGYDAMSNDYQYRAITNPIWINVIQENCLNTGDVDLNGNITANDSQLVFYIVLGLFTPTYEQECAADCNGDGNITASDSQTVFMSILGLDSCVDPL